MNKMYTTLPPLLNNKILWGKYKSEAPNRLHHDHFCYTEKAGKLPVCHLSCHVNQPALELPTSVTGICTVSNLPQYEKKTGLGLNYRFGSSEIIEHLIN